MQFDKTTSTSPRCMTIPVYTHHLRYLPPHPVLKALTMPFVRQLTNSLPLALALDDSSGVRQRYQDFTKLYIRSLSKGDRSPSCRHDGRHLVRGVLLVSTTSPHACMSSCHVLAEYAWGIQQINSPYRARVRSTALSTPGGISPAGRMLSPRVARCSPQRPPWGCRKSAASTAYAAFVYSRAICWMDIS